MLPSKEKKQWIRFPQKPPSKESTRKKRGAQLCLAAWCSRATQHGVAMPPCWPALIGSLARHTRAGKRGISVLNLWSFHAMLSDLFRNLKLASLALLFAEYHPFFCSFNKILENIERCYMSEIYAKGGWFDPFLTWSNMKISEKGSQIGAKMGLK